MGRQRCRRAASDLLNATPGNLSGLVIVLATLRAGEYMLVKASIAGAIVTDLRDDPLPPAPSSPVTWCSDSPSRKRH
jgi:hypothetical protein